ncbi:hypothetical protein ACMD2_01654 [Ananas comosus]|uniref:Uncharacterized protein n=1 Tax=Ananas comosus TaxID=4615 RepID=A0A199VYE7_ANACO|nr:hypothetical protein ACMD2_01654 [Ananas comosus]
MAMPWGLTIHLMKMVWMVLHGRGDIGPLPVG